MIKNRKPDLPKTLTDQLDDLLGRSGDADRIGDGQSSIRLVEEAWSMIPEPKTEWNFYPQTIARATVEVIPSIGRCDVLDTWLDRMYATHFDPDRQAVYTNLIAGHALYQCGRKEEAVAIFLQVLQKDGPAWFTGEYRPYLTLAEKALNDGA